MKLCLPFGCLFDRAPEVRFWSSGPRRDHWQERKPSRRRKEGEVGRSGEAQCEMFHDLMAELLHCCLTNESLVFEWHQWSSHSSSSSPFLFPFSVCHPSPLPSIHYCQSISSKKTSYYNSPYMVNTTHITQHTFTNSLTPVNVLTHTGLMRDIINDDLWRLCLSPPW